MSQNAVTGATITPFPIQNLPKATKRKSQASGPLATVIQMADRRRPTITHDNEPGPHLPYTVGIMGSGCVHQRHFASLSTAQFCVELAAAVGREARIIEEGGARG